jgi:hypothetical protein
MAATYPDGFGAKQLAVLVVTCWAELTWNSGGAEVVAFRGTAGEDVDVTKTKQGLTRGRSLCGSGTRSAGASR